MKAWDDALEAHAAAIRFWDPSNPNTQQDQSPENALMRRRTHEHLMKAETVLVAKDMCELLDTAWPGLNDFEYDLSDLAQMGSEFFVYFEVPIVVDSETLRFFHISMSKSITLVGWGDESEAISGYWDHWPIRDTDDAVKETPHIRMVVACLIMMQQRLAIKQKERGSRKTLRRLAQLKIPERPDLGTVTMVFLRRPEGQLRSDEETGRTLQYRHLVRGHWKRVGKEKKKIFIWSYVRGPEDAPFKLSVRRFHWIR